MNNLFIGEACGAEQFILMYLFCRVVVVCTSVYRLLRVWVCVRVCVIRFVCVMPLLFICYCCFFCRIRIFGWMRDPVVWWAVFLFTHPDTSFEISNEKLPVILFVCCVMAFGTQSIYVHTHTHTHTRMHKITFIPFCFATTNNRNNWIRSNTITIPDVRSTIHTLWIMYSYSVLREVQHWLFELLFCLA